MLLYITSCDSSKSVMGGVSKILARASNDNLHLLEVRIFGYEKELAVAGLLLLLEEDVREIV